ncbi:MAG: T9SS type A sorting domain-containing protein, partial [Bacteroidota bacterium]
SAPAVTLTGTPSGGIFSGSGISSNQFNPATATVGTNTITYTVASLGCTYTKTQNVTITSGSSASIAGLNANYCINANATSLSGAPLGGSFSGTGVSGTQFNPATAGVGGPYTVTYQGSSGGCNFSTTQPVTVNALPLVAVAGNADTLCSNATAVTLTGGIPAGGTYSGTGVTGNSFNPATAGLGAKVITYTYTDGNGCSNSSTETIIVKSCTTTGIDDLTEPSINIYPNPAKDELIVACDLFTGLQPVPYIYDLSGKLQTLSYKQLGDRIIIHTSFLAAGSYWIQLSVNGRNITRNFVKAD